MSYRGGGKLLEWRKAKVSYWGGGRLRCPTGVEEG